MCLTSVHHDGTASGDSMGTRGWRLGSMGRSEMDFNLPRVTILWGLSLGWLSSHLWSSRGEVGAAVGSDGCALEDASAQQALDRVTFGRIPC